MATIKMIVRNAQGASDETAHESREDARDHLRATWHDPENLTAQLIDLDGVTVWEGPAAELMAWAPGEHDHYSDAEFSAALVEQLAP